MSKITAALEVAVSQVIANTPADGTRGSARQRAEVDRAFARILKLIAPRIRHFVRQYGLMAHWDDAEQCCAIAVHRAIQSYDPTKAQFTTFVNWQIRGELQSLRFRLMTDQRPSAKKGEATTVSLQQLVAGTDGEDAFEATLVDEDALETVEAGASDYLARAATECLIEEFVKKGRTAALEQLRRQQPKRALAKAQARGPRLKSALIGVDPAEVDKVEAKFARDRDILLQRVFGEMENQESLEDVGITKERIRQIGKRAAKGMAELAASHPKFALMAEYRAPVPGRLAA